MRVRRLPIVEDLEFVEGTVVLTMQHAQLLSPGASAIWRTLSADSWAEIRGVPTNVDIVAGLCRAGLVEVAECSR